MKRLRQREREFYENDERDLACRAFPDQHISTVYLTGTPLTAEADSEIVAWGDNRIGQAAVPSGLTNVVAIAAGESGLALTAGGQVVEWGAHYNPFTGIGEPMPVEQRGGDCGGGKSESGSHC